MVERIEDLNLPNAVIARLIKDALPEGAVLSKEARAAIARAASVFIIYLTSTSTTLAHSQSHKTISTTNVLDALKKLEFEGFVEPLKEHLEAFRRAAKEKKDNKTKKDATEEANSSAANTELVGDEAGEETVEID